MIQVIHSTLSVSYDIKEQHGARFMRIFVGNNQIARLRTFGERWMRLTSDTYGEWYTAGFTEDEAIANTLKVLGYVK